jgi:hypothetical protein
MCVKISLENHTHMNILVIMNGYEKVIITIKLCIYERQRGEKFILDARV